MDDLGNPSRIEQRQVRQQRESASGLLHNMTTGENGVTAKKVGQ